MTDPPIITGDDLAAALGGRPNPALCELIAGAVSDAVAAEVDPPPDPLPVGWVWSDGERQAATLAGLDLFRVQSAQGAGFVLDEQTWTNERYTKSAVQRYEALYAGRRAVGGMIG